MARQSKLINSKDILEMIQKISDDYVDNNELNNLLQNKADKTELFSGSYNDLTDKPIILSVEDLPCYDSREYETVTFTYDGSKGTKEVFDVVPGEVSFVKITDNISMNDLERLNTADVTICTSSSDGQTQEYTINVADSGGCEFVQENIYRAAESFILLVLEDTDFSGIGIAKGIWFMHVNESSLSDYYAKSLTYNTCISGELKKLDEKYLEKKPGICSEGKVYTYTVYEDPDERTTETTLTDISGAGAESFNTTEYNEPKAIGECSHAEGVETIAYGFASHAEGDENVALGEASHVEGLYTYAVGYAAHAEGVVTSAMKDSSHAEGECTVANCESQHVQGKYNIKDTEDKYAHIVGNGSSIEERSNAHTLDWDGNAWFAGKATVSVQPTDNNDLTTKLYVDQSISQVNEDLQNQINGLFQNVSSGKELIASAITDKGVDASEEETFQSLSEKIGLIPSGPPGSNIIGYIDEENDIYVSLTELESGTYTLKFEDYAGLLNEFDDIGTVEVE